MLVAWSVSSKIKRFFRAVVGKKKSVAQSFSFLFAELLCDLLSSFPLLVSPISSLIRQSSPRLSLTSLSHLPLTSFATLTVSPVFTLTSRFYPRRNWAEPLMPCSVKIRVCALVPGVGSRSLTQHRPRLLLLLLPSLCVLPIPALALKEEAVRCLCIECCCKSNPAWLLLLLDLRLCRNEGWFWCPSKLATWGSCCP